MCVCVPIYTHVSIYVYVFIYVYVGIYVYVFIYVYVATYICVYVGIYVCVHITCLDVGLALRIEDGPDKDKGVKCGDVEISYWMIQQDVRRTVDWIHNEVTPDILKHINFARVLLPVVLGSIPYHNTPCLESIPYTSNLIPHGIASLESIPYT